MVIKVAYKVVPLKVNFSHITKETKTSQVCLPTKKFVGNDIENELKVATSRCSDYYKSDLPLYVREYGGS